MVQLVALALLTLERSPNLTLRSTQVRTYFQSIEPVIRAKCLPCHAPGRSAPFSLSTYDQVRKHSDLIRVKAMTFSMPPTLGESDFGKLSKSSKMTDSEIVDLQKWMQAGMPRGIGEDRPTAPIMDWHLGKPTKTISLKSSSSVRTEGPRYWMTNVVEVAIDGDLKAFDIVPEDRKALQSVTLAYITPDMSKVLPKIAESFGSVSQIGAMPIGAWAPGYKSWILPRDVGLRIPKGSRLIVQAHYQPLGRKTSPNMKLGLYFASSPQPKQAKWITMSKDAFEIPANEAVSFSLQKVLVRPCRVISILPEARFYCSKIRLMAESGTKSKRVFETMAWNPYWVGNFAPQAPIELGANTRLSVTFNYNNDERCSINEGKVPTLVRSGKKLGDELCKMHVLTAPL
jgi:hypothetical protein